MLVAQGHSGRFGFGEVAKLVGEDWIWHATEQSSAAIALLLEMTREPDRQVRYDAVYHGLSTVRSKSDELIRRLVTAKSMRLGEVQEALRKRLDAPFRPFTVRLAGGQALFLSKRQSLALRNEVLVVIEAQDRVRTIELRQIAAIEDLPAKAERR